VSRTTPKELRDLAAQHREAAEQTRQEALAERRLLASRDTTSRLQSKLADALQEHSGCLSQLVEVRRDAALMQHFLRGSWKQTFNVPSFELSKLGTPSDGGSGGYVSRDYRDYRPDFTENSRLGRSHWAEGLRRLSEELGMKVPAKGGDWDHTGGDTQ